MSLTVKLQEQVTAMASVCNNFRFLVNSTPNHKEKQALRATFNHLRELYGVYQSRLAAQERQESLNVIDINDYQEAKARG